MTKLNPDQKQYNDLVLVPKKLLEEILETQETILQRIEELQGKKQTKNLIAGKYISESDAKEMLGKGTTWFWKIRKEGKIKYRKLGNRIFYSIEDIEVLLDQNIVNE